MAHQYDQWHQNFTIKDQDGNILVPTDPYDSENQAPDNARCVAGLSIMINDRRYVYPADIDFDDDTLKWSIAIDNEQTDLERILSFQCAVDFGNETVIHSDKVNTRLSPSLDWSEDD